MKLNIRFRNKEVLLKADYLMSSKSNVEELTAEFLIKHGYPIDPKTFKVKKGYLITRRESLENGTYFLYRKYSIKEILSVRLRIILYQLGLVRSKFSY